MEQERNLPQEESPAQETLLLGHSGTVQFPHAHPHKLCTLCVCVHITPSCCPQVLEREWGWE